MKKIYFWIKRLVFLLLTSQLSFVLNAQMKNPDIGFSFTNGTCAPAVVQFINKSSLSFDTAKIKFKWFLNNAQTPFFVGYLPGNQTFQKGFYNLRVEADSLGFGKGYTNRNFEVKGIPKAFMPVNNAQYCPGEEIMFQINEPVNNVVWSFGDNSFFDPYQNNVHKYINPGTYQVKVKFDSECGSDSIKQFVVITSTAQPTVTAYSKGDWNVCLNDAVSFNTNGKYKSYFWDLGDGTTSDQANPFHSYSAVKMYNIILTATNICGQTGKDTVQINVQNNIPAFAGFNWWYERSSCPNSPVRFDANSAGMYKWEFGDGGTSNLRNPVNSYSDTGKYLVKLTVTNGCGNTTSQTQPVFIKFDPNIMPPQANFYIRTEYDNNKNDNPMGMDTLKVCPGTRLFFESNIGDDGSLLYNWSFGDGTIAKMRSTEHIYTAPGVYAVTYKVYNQCGGMNTTSRLVKVDKFIKPMAMLKAVPQVICPGEPVFFFDNENDPEKTRNRYSIFFGDGTNMLNITKNTDTVMQTLATHIYQALGVYNYKFKVTNICGNSDSIAGAINVQGDAAKVPFYYVDNSTTTRTDGVQDWSKRSSFSDNKIIIPVKWDEWPGTDSVITAFFFWGKFDPANMDNNSDPAGKAGIKVKNIISNGVDTIVAYVPFDPVASDSVGIAVAWFCNHFQNSNGPNAFAMPLKVGGIPVTSIKVIPAGVTNLSTLYPPGVVFAPNAFTGTCAPDAKGDWVRKVAEGNFYLTGIYNGQYNITQAQKPSWDGSNNHITSGDYITKGDTIIFMSGDKCQGTGVYKFMVKGRIITFTLLTDGCDLRKQSLAGFSFAMLDDQNIQDRSGCPGDMVQFKIAGGKSYEWHFGDNSPVSTAANAYHAYADTGKYHAFVIATNACGRKDTIHSWVSIGKFNTPNAYFNLDKYWVSKGDTVRFYYNGDSENDVNKYVWDFGDGGTSILRNPMHQFLYKGGYNINLKVTNGCGTSTNMQNIQVGDAFDQCNIQAKFAVVKADTAKLWPNIPVKFLDNSFGNLTKRTWDFGDGMLDTASNPSHTFTRGGVYKVCLSVYDMTTQCSDQICMELAVGTLPCKADYGFIVNNSTNTVKFNNTSLKANKFFWDFNDGMVNNLPSPVHQFNKPGVYNVCLVTYDTISKCQAKRCDIITVGQIDTSRYCKAEYSFFVNHENNEVNFKNQSIGNIKNGYWNFGDGLFGYEENPMHKFAKPGVYKVCANIVDSSGCQSSVCKEIQVGVINCKSEFSYFIEPVTNKVVFTDNSIGKNLKPFWNFGDGNYNNSPNPVYQYNQPGLYKVCHFIKDTVSGCVSENCMELAIGEVKCNVDYSFIIEPTTKMVKFKGISNTTLLKWNWDFGDGNSDSSAMPEKIYQREGLYNVCLRVYDPVKNCVADRCKVIAIGSATNVAAVDADFSFNLEPQVLKAQFNDKSTGNPNKFHWDFGDGKFSNLKSPDHVYNKPGVFKVCQTVADTVTGKISQECKEVFLAAKICRADFSFFVNPEAKTVTFVDLSSPGIKENYWDFGNGKFSIKKDAMNIYDGPGLYKVCKTIIDSTGCQAQVCKKIQLGSLACKADYNYMIDPASKTVKFINNSSGNITSYFWEFGDGNFSNLKDPAHAFVKPGVYKVSLYTKNTIGDCVSEISKEIQVGAVNCEAAFSFLVDAVNRTVSLRNESKGNAVKFNWNNGLGMSDTLPDTKFVYAADGKYQVCLQIYDPTTNCKANICKEVVIRKDTSSLIESFAADFNYFINPDSNKVVLFDKSTGNPSNYYWTFGDGQFYKGKDAAHIYITPGIFKVCHSIFSTATGKFDEKCKELIVGQEPCSITAGFSLFVDPKTRSVFMSDNSKGSVTSWFWRFGDGNTSNKPNPAHIYAKPGYYLISLAVRDTVKGCTDYYADFVQVGTVECKAMYEYTVDMTAKALTLQNKSLGDLSKYYWQFGDGGNSVDKDPVHTYENAGLYRVALIASNADGTCKDFYAEPIQVGTIDCSAAFEYYVDSVTNVAYFKNKTIGTATKYFWIFGDGSASNVANPIHKYVAPGYYKVGLNTFNPINGCMDYYEEVLLIGSEGIDCQADFYYQVDDANKTIKLFDKSTGKGLSFLWNFGDGGSSTSNEPSHTYAKGGYYTICLTVYAANGVQNTTCRRIKVAAEDLTNCMADFIFTVDTTTRKVDFTNKSFGGGNKYLWGFGDGSGSEVENPTHTYATSGFYNVKMVIKNETTGCTSATMKLVSVSSSQTLRASFGYGLDTVKLKAASGYPVSFVGLSSGDPAKYVWDFGDGSKDSTTTSPSHTYAAAGNYNVCLTVSDPVTSQVNKYCSSLKVGALGVPNFAENAASMVAYPNPFNSNTSIVVDIVSAGNYELTLYDVSGREVKAFFNTRKNTGSYWIIWDGKEIEDGVYYLKLSKGAQVIKTLKLIKQN